MQNDRPFAFLRVSAPQRENPSFAAVGNRRLGMAYCGGQRWVIEDNLFEGNGGTAPGFGVDFEDGWLVMQDVVFRNNKFKDNIRGDLVVCAGSELLFEGNELGGVVINYSEEGPEVLLEAQGNQGTLEQKGPGLGRRMSN